VTLPPRSRQARDETAADRVSHHGKNDRNDRCRPLRRNDGRGSIGNNDVDLEPDELGRDLCSALGAPLCPTNLDGDGACLDPAEFTQPLYQSGEPVALGRRRALAQEPDGRQLRRLLRARRERPRGRAAKHPEKFAPPHLSDPKQS
jgi:hypothetical protein